LAAQAAKQGWAREAERHQTIARRIARLLADLGQPIDPATQEAT